MCRVRLVDAEYAGRWELPVLGPVAAPGAVLVRPDGHVAWRGDRIPEDALCVIDVVRGAADRGKMV